MGRAIGFLYGSNTLGAVLGAVLGEAYLIGAFGLYGTSLAAGAAVCVAAAIALAVARFGAARYGAGFKGADPSERSKFPLSFDASYRPPWRLLFVSFGTGLILLALEVIWFRFLRSVCRLVADGFRHHARSCAGGNRTRRTLRPARLISVHTVARINCPYLVAACGDFCAFILSIFSGRDGTNARWRF